VKHIISRIIDKTRRQSPLWKDFSEAIHDCFVPKGVGGRTLVQSRNKSFYNVKTRLPNPEDIYTNLEDIYESFKERCETLEKNSEDNTIVHLFHNDFDTTFYNQLNTHIAPEGRRSCIGDALITNDKGELTHIMESPRKDGQFLVNRGTNRNESLHARLNAKMFRTATPELRDNFLLSFASHWNLQRTSGMNRCVLGGVDPSIVSVAMFPSIFALNKLENLSTVTFRNYNDMSIAVNPAILNYAFDPKKTKYNSIRGYVNVKGNRSDRTRALAPHRPTYTPPSQSSIQSLHNTQWSNEDITLLLQRMKLCKELYPSQNRYNWTWVLNCDELRYRTSEGAKAIVKRQSKKRKADTNSLHIENDVQRHQSELFESLSDTQNNSVYDTNVYEYNDTNIQNESISSSANNMCISNISTRDPNSICQSDVWGIVPFYKMGESDIKGNYTNTQKKNLFFQCEDRSKSQSIKDAIQRTELPAKNKNTTNALTVDEIVILAIVLRNIDYKNVSKARKNTLIDNCFHELCQYNHYRRTVLNIPFTLNVFRRSEGKKTKNWYDTYKTYTDKENEKWSKFRDFIAKTPLLSTNDAYIEEIKQFRDEINGIVNNLSSKQRTLFNNRNKEKKVQSNTNVIDIESDNNMEEEEENTSNTNNNNTQPTSFISNLLGWGR